MYCNRCGSQIPDDSAFCGNCGAPIGGAARSSGPVAARRAETPPTVTNLLNTLKAFFSKQPESSLAIAKDSQTFEWAILIGANVLLFAFAFAVNIRQIFSSMLSAIGGEDVREAMEMLGLNLSDLVKFGYFFLFGLLIAIVANAIVFGAYYLLQKVIQRGEQTTFGMLNTVAVSTIPFTVVFVLNMILGLIWGVLPIPMLLIAALAQVLLLYMALQENAPEYRASFVCFLGVCLIVLLLVCLFGFLFTKAAFSSSISSFSRSYRW